MLCSASHRPRSLGLYLFHMFGNIILPNDIHRFCVIKKAGAIDLNWIL